ncbi:MAG: ParB/RepB/Spo0J family partition protein [Gammaproteobacteria bacterium]|nr:MAG: ParB/RepB/Spo0J family partition protein [Gammaproteobacteria bacterium]
MSKKKHGLGRGLDALLGMGAGTLLEPEEEPLLRQLPVEMIQQGRYQPRHDIRSETLQELADSIRAQGVVQPIVVRPLESQDGYEIIAGERRWRAAQIAGLTEVPAIVKQVPDQAAMSIALIENIQREELNPLEEALALQRLITEFELTHQEVAEAVGRSRAAVSNLLRLLELTEEVKRMLEVGDIEMGHARALLPLDESLQVKAAHQVIARGLSVRETEALVRRFQQEGAPPAPEKPAPDPDTRRLETDLGEKLGARVQLRHGARGKGRLVIHYNSLDELEGILSHIR